MEERQIQELRQLQVAHGQQVKTVDSTLDWMYQGPAGHDALVKQQTTEEYLLGLFLFLFLLLLFQASNEYAETEVLIMTTLILRQNIQA